ncbi:NADH dehydrogenase subunit L [Singulisphaera sp. GP187]|uniref:NADH-quinone oxidoreductase subunit L n=1 Tax=Singulisphaera sp. GP187 TaxID=1882752 RepID=UPI000926D02E|nr:NADH-quinone oxidoreductase subunit L [Singulisphaera sp. GP187]SIO65614.1 NADH dehydrogenase subunit L [Singulisphaera sp. GP187]
MSWQAGLYVAAVLIPLAAFTIEIIGIRLLGRLNAYLATGAIGLSFLLSAVGFFQYFFVEAEGVLASHHPHAAAHAEPGETEAAAATEEAAPEKEEHAKGPLVWRAHYDWVIGGTQAVSVVGQAAGPALVIPLAVHIDNLTVIMFLMVTFIATLIHIYSMGYMHDDPGYPRFFTFLSLFCFSMLGLVASANVFMIFMFWELVGVCSYLLVGFWYQEKKNCNAANKAFIVNRVGDIGMLIGLGLIWTSFGTFDINTINHSLRDNTGRLHVEASAQGDTAVVTLHDQESGEVLKNAVSGKPLQIPFWALTLAGLGIFAGCAGKSAQFPLHVWLPDAMAGPTPVSALIHAATMVAAGVYLVGRFFPLFTPDVQLYIAYTGAITLFIAATIAAVQNDYKKVLAYSTVSQLGFMMLGLGVGGWAAGLFHLLTHAFFKALLFLGAGSIYHAVHTYEMPVLGGLRKKMPITAYTMLAATLAISGVPLFSGFYSKDAILASSIYFVFGEHNTQHILLFLLPAIGAALTAFYMFRMWFLVFAGEPRGYPAAEPHGHGSAHGHGGHHGNPYDHAHESPPIMTWPLMILAVPTIIIGYPFTILPVSTSDIAKPVVERMLEYGEPVVRQVHVESLHQSHLLAMGASVLILAVGVGLGVLFYAPPLPYVFRKRQDARVAAERLGGLYGFFVNKWYFDELYDAALVQPTLAIARLCSEFDRRIIDGTVNGMAKLTQLLSKSGGLFDKVAVDSLVNLTARTVYSVGDWSRGIQTGRIRNYLMFLAVALVGLFVGVFAWIRP